MKIDFGIVDSYFPDKGFGFVTNPLDKFQNGETFFHISAIKHSDVLIYRKLAIYEPGNLIFFWYESESSRKGTRVRRLIKKDVLTSLLNSSLYRFLLTSNYVPVLKKMWKEIEREQPIWLDELSSLFIEENELNKLKEERLELERQKVDIDEKRRIEEERLRKIMEEKRRIEEEEKTQQREAKKLEESKEAEEFELLVAEMQPKGFTTSAQVSNYIIHHRLGDKYKHISGVLRMEDDYSTWNFNGGFPPKVYAMLCERLNLGNKGTSSRVVDFTPFKDL